MKRLKKFFKSQGKEKHKDGDPSDSRYSRSETPSIRTPGVGTDTLTPENISVISQGPNLGIKMLYGPERAEDAEVDVVFVHGLTGNAFKTWYHTESKIHWPHSLLKTIVPNCRVFSFGYDADVASFWGGASKNRLADHARGLIGNLVGEREDTNTETRRIIFVAHSLGGLVVERALRISKDSAERHYHQIELSVVGIIFLGTPHTGSGFAPFAKVVAKILEASGKRVNSDILDVLKRDSQTLIDIEDWFAQWLRIRTEENKAVQITSFFEEMALHGGNKVVDESSAKIIGYEYIGIHANHMDMTKFYGLDDPGFKLVSREIRRWIKNISSQTGTIDAIVSDDPERKKRVNNFLAQLYLCPYQDRKDVNQKRIPGTCEWFIGHERFKHWNENPSSKLLWVSADPGTGKSVLSKYLVDEILPKEEVAVCYFFFKDGFADQQSASIAACALLRQLLVHRPHLLQDWVLDEVDRYGEQLFTVFHNVWGIIIQILQNGGAGKVIFVLDALDECNEGHLSHLSAKVREHFLENNNPNLKLLLTSRPYDHIWRQFQELEDMVPEIHLSGENEEEVEKISNEIDLVVKYRISLLSKRKRLLPHEEDHIQKLFARVPNRTYLWVTLTLDFIEQSPGCTTGSVTKAINNCPKTVDEAYNNILAKSPDTGKALKVLKIVLASFTPLTVEEMAIAMTLDDCNESYQQFQDELEPPERFRISLRELCGLLLVVVSDHVYLLHQTAREFLVSRDIAAPNYTSGPQHYGSSNWKHSISMAHAHAGMAEACMTYLLNKFDLANWRFQPHAYSYWTGYIRKSGSEFGKKTVKKQLDILHRFCDPGDLRNKGILLVSDKKGQLLDECLVLASWWHLTAVVELLTETNQANPNIRVQCRRTPLILAVQSGNIPIIRALLAHRDIDPNLCADRGWTALHQAVEFRKYDAINPLVQSEKVDVNILDCDKKTPLMLAAKWYLGPKAASNGVEVILSRKDLKVNMVDSNGRMAFMLGVLCYNWPFLKLLSKDKRIDFDMIDNEGHDALTLCTKKSGGDPTPIEILLVEFEVDFGPSSVSRALIEAAKRNHKYVAMALLDTGKADLEQTDCEGNTAIAWATKNQNPDLLELLTGRLNIDTGCTGEDEDTGPPSPSGELPRTGSKSVMDEKLEEEDNEEGGSEGEAVRKKDDEI